MSSLVGKYVGVTFNLRKNRWIVRYSHQGVRKYIGSFIFEEDANKAYEEFLESLNITIKDSASVEALPSEEFRPVIGYEEDYIVSNLGRVCSIKYGKYRLLKPYKTGTGYRLVKLNGKSRVIHLLVAAAFLGHNSNGTHELVVDHIDRDKENNCVDNLQVVTQRENVVKDSTNEYIGATLHKKSGRYFSRVYFGRKHIYLGYFNTKKEASAAYQKALLALEKGEEIVVEKKAHSSKYKGVSKLHKTNNYKATIFIDGKNRNLGRFSNEEDAHRAYQKALLEKQIKNKE